MRERKEKKIKRAADDVLDVIKFEPSDEMVRNLLSRIQYEHARKKAFIAVTIGLLVSIAIVFFVLPAPFNFISIIAMIGPLSAILYSSIRPLYYGPSLNSIKYWK